MNKKLIKEDYSKKFDLINKYKKFYIEKNKSIIPDSEYDNLKQEVLLLEKSIHI